MHKYLLMCLLAMVTVNTGAQTRQKSGEFKAIKSTSQKIFLSGEYFSLGRDNSDTLTYNLFLSTDSFKIVYLIQEKDRSNCRFPIVSGKWELDKQHRVILKTNDGTIIKGKFSLPETNTYPQTTYLELENGPTFNRVVQ